jgi:hypothetical protein
MAAWGVQEKTFSGFRCASPPWTIAVILLVLWVVGVLSSTTFGGLIHVLLPTAILVYAASAIRERENS